MFRVLGLSSCFARMLCAVVGLFSKEGSVCPLFSAKQNNSVEIGKKYLTIKQKKRAQTQFVRQGGAGGRYRLGLFCCCLFTVASIPVKCQSATH